MTSTHHSNTEKKKPSKLLNGDACVLLLNQAHYIIISLVSQQQSNLFRCHLSVSTIRFDGLGWLVFSSGSIRRTRADCRFYFISVAPIIECRYISTNREKHIHLVETSLFIPHGIALHLVINYTLCEIRRLNTNICTLYEIVYNYDQFEY